MCSEVMQLFHFHNVDIMLSASSISDKFAIPVDKIIGFIVFATFSTNGKLIKSNDANL